MAHFATAQQQRLWVVDPLSLFSRVQCLLLWVMVFFVLVDFCSVCILSEYVRALLFIATDMSGGRQPRLHRLLSS